MPVGNNIKDALFGGEDGPWVTIGDVKVDASIEEIHGFDAEVTQLSVEGGSEINDHYKKRPPEIDITGIVSNIKLEYGYPGRTAVEAFRTNDSNDPHIEAWQTVKSYWTKGVLVTIVTSLETYESMAITSFRVTRANGKKDSLHFTCHAKKMRIVSTETTGAIEIPQPKDESVKSEKADKGKKQTKGANSKKQEKASRSFLKGG